MVEANEVRKEARRFLKNTNHLLIGDAKVAEIINALQQFLAEKEAMIHAFTLLPPEEGATRKFKQAYEIAIRQKSKAESLLRNLMIT